MKTLLTFLLAAALAPAAGAADAPKTYADAQRDLALLSMRAAGTHKALKAKIQQNAADIETVRRLEHAKIKVEEMIQRDNIAKACKVVDVAFTVGTMGVGGIAAATKEGVSVLSKEGAKIAAKYIGKKAAVEAGKESAGVPGYSDSVKVGVYIFNKADESELKGQLSRDNIDLLNRAKRLLEDTSDDRKLKDKLPELHQLLLEAEGKAETSLNQARGLDKLMDDYKKEGEALITEGRRLKAEEKKAADAEAAKAKLAKPAGLVDTSSPKPAEVQPPPAAPQEDPAARKRRIQSAIDAYIASLGGKIAAAEKEAEKAWLAAPKPPGTTYDYDPSGRLDSDNRSLEYLEGQLADVLTYSAMQSLEKSARTLAKSVNEGREAQRSYAAVIKSDVEPHIAAMADLAARWKSVYDTYVPQGFTVADPPVIRGGRTWSLYYEGPLGYAEAYLRGTEGLADKFGAVASRAQASKNAIFAEAKEAAAAYSAKLKEYGDYAPQAAGQLEKLNSQLAKHYEVLNGLPHAFVVEFSREGAGDLASLEAVIRGARSAFSAAQRLEAGGAAIYLDLTGRLEGLKQLGDSPGMQEARFISYGAEEPAHKEAIAPLLKSEAGYTPSLSGTEGWQHERTASSELMFGAEEALAYLKSQEAKLLASYDRAIAAFRANSARDLSYLSKLPPDEYGKEIDRIFAPAQRAEEEKQEITSETAGAPLFGGSERPLLKNTGFWTKAAGERASQLEKATAAFWESGAGKAVAEARRLRELGVDPGGEDKVRAFYDKFRAAYEGRNAGAVMNLVSPDWSSGDEVGDFQELESSLRASFRLYDEIKYSVTGLKAESLGRGGWRACYEAAITSRIFKRNLKHEEKSSVCEELREEDGKLRIVRTLSGRYWSAQ
ncbi:MAG: hypothetical protein AB1734_04580 [Elusimicrobiota bacterium]|jgi:hypothetical protein